MIWDNSIILEQSSKFIYFLRMKNEKGDNVSFQFVLRFRLEINLHVKIFIISNYNKCFYAKQN